MKTKNIIFTISIASLGLFSCEKAIKVEPKTSVAAETALSDVKSYQALVVSVYDRIQSFTYHGRDMALMGDALADNTFVETTIDGRYSGQNRNTRGSHYNIWTQCYSTLNELNTIVAGIDKAPGLTSDEPLRAKIKGQALALRAMILFDLARVYGYEPKKIPTTGLGSGFNKSVILRLSPTSTASDAVILNRSTVEETYAAIEKDLLAAIAVLPVETANTSVYTMNKAAANALLGKVYLYWEKYSLAIPQFDAALNSANTPARLSTNIVSAFKSVPNTESLFELRYIQAVEVAGVTGVNDTPYSYTQPSLRNDLGISTYGSQTISDELFNLFNVGDQRLGFIFIRGTATTGANTYRWSSKYSSSNGQYTDNIKIIRYSDVLLMKAEAQAGTNDFTGAVTTLSTLRTARGATGILLPADASIRNVIQDERRRELFHEGHRWFDLKRLGAGITKPAKRAVGTVPPDDYRILAPIPNGEVTFNTSLPQNPNY